MRRASLALLVLAATGCARPQGSWRDQYAFVGDDGTVLLLALQRQSTGIAEVKGWLGRDGRWAATEYRRFAIPGRSAADRAAVLEAWRDVPDVPAHVALDRAGDRLALDLRLPSRAVQLRAPALVELGRSTDPEGTSIYRAGRAQLGDGETVWKGWLIVEETPRAKPRKPFVDYGDFAFIVLAGAGRDPIVLKHSRELPAYDHAFAGGAAPRQTGAVSVERDGDELVVALPDWDVRARARVLDRDSARGTAPDGSPVVYETLLLGGDYAGIAFAIHPPTRRSP